MCCHLPRESAISTDRIERLLDSEPFIQKTQVGSESPENRFVGKQSGRHSNDDGHFDKLLKEGSTCVQATGIPHLPILKWKKDNCIANFFRRENLADQI